MGAVATSLATGGQLEHVEGDEESTPELRFCEWAIQDLNL